MGDKVSKDDDNFLCGPVFCRNCMCLRKELIVLELYSKHRSTPFYTSLWFMDILKEMKVI